MILVINIDEVRKQNTTLKKIKQTLSKYKLKDVELIIFNVIGENYKHENKDRIEMISEIFSEKLGKKCEIRF